MIPRYQPMLATAWPGPFSDPDWAFEPKWDGYRLNLTFDGTSATLRSRRGNDVTGRYRDLANVRFDRPLVLDGEVVVLDENGAPSFELLQRGGAVGTLRFAAFDVLYDGAGSIVEQPWEERRARLETLEVGSPVTVSPVVREDGPGLWRSIVERDLEGMVAKRLSSPYRPGTRSPDWRKMHHIHSTKAVVGGFTPGEGGRAASFGGLLVGHWDGERLRWAGSVGTGFSDSDLRAIRATLGELERRDSPFHEDPQLPRGARWVEPALVAVVGFRNWTEAGRLRHPRFLGFADTPVEDVTVAAERSGPNGP